MVHAQEFWRQHGLSEAFKEHVYPVHWLSERAALLVQGVFPLRQ